MRKFILWLFLTCRLRQWLKLWSSWAGPTWVPWRHRESTERREYHPSYRLQGSVKPDNVKFPKIKMYSLELMRAEQYNSKLRNVWQLTQKIRSVHCCVSDYQQKCGWRGVWRGCHNSPQQWKGQGRLHIFLYQVFLCFVSGRGSVCGWGQNKVKDWSFLMICCFFYLRNIFSPFRAIYSFLEWVQIFGNNHNKKHSYCIGGIFRKLLGSTVRKGVAGKFYWIGSDSWGAKAALNIGKQWMHFTMCIASCFIYRPAQTKRVGG